MLAAWNEVWKDNTIIVFATTNDSQCKWNSVQFSTEDAGSIWESDSFSGTTVNYCCGYLVPHSIAICI